MYQAIWQFVYTRCLDKADGIETECQCGLDMESAKKNFDAKVKEILAQVLDNENLHGTMDIHNMRAVIQVEGVRHVVAAMVNTEENAI